MARRGWIVTTALLATAVMLAAAPLPPAWKNWRYSRTIVLPPADATRLAAILVPEDVFRRSRTGLPDLRVMDDLGGETPYVTRTREGSTNTVLIPAKLVENSFAPGNYTQVVLDLGAKTPFHNTLEIQTTETDFIEWVSVDVSDDARLWRIVQPRAPFFRFEKQSLAGTQTVSYSENNARYLRIHVLDQAKKFPVIGASVVYRTVVAGERAPLEATFTPSAPSSAGRSAWTADFVGPRMPPSELWFDVAAPEEFIRSVEIASSSDGKEWETFAQGEIYRYRQAEAAQEQLSVSIPSGGEQGRYWRVEVINGNDAPLDGVVLRLSTIPRHVFFEQRPGRSYRLLYGQSRAEAPQYDLSRRLEAKQEVAAVAGQVGSEEENPNYSDPEPWTEKNGYLLWIVMGIAVVILGYSAIRSLRRSSADLKQDP